MLDVLSKLVSNLRFMYELSNESLYCKEGMWFVLCKVALTLPQLIKICVANSHENW